jgi:hypothetical protein
MLEAALRKSKADVETLQRTAAEAEASLVELQRHADELQVTSRICLVPCKARSAGVLGKQCLPSMLRHDETLKV